MILASAPHLYSAVLRSADPRLARDLSIGEFLVAFGIYREVVCSVFPQRRKELDGYLDLIGDLNLCYGKHFFYQYHKGFSSKAALHVSRSNVLLDWSVLDTELLVLRVVRHLFRGESIVITSMRGCASTAIAPFSIFAVAARKLTPGLCAHVGLALREVAVVVRIDAPPRQ